MTPNKEDYLKAIYKLGGMEELVNNKCWTICRNPVLLSEVVSGAYEGPLTLDLEGQAHSNQL